MASSTTSAPEKKQEMLNSTVPKPKVAILIVNGGDDPKEGSWIELCLGRINRFTRPGLFQLYLWNNNPGSKPFLEAVATYAPSAHLFEPEPGEVLYEFHAIPLQRMYEAAKMHDYEWILTMDSDAHPLRDDWLEKLMQEIQEPVVLGGIWRDELAAAIDPYVHASCLCVRQSFLVGTQRRFDTVATAKSGDRVDTLSDFTHAALSSGGTLLPLVRSNAGQFHFLIGGIYGDLLYHHGAGSRRNILFWGEIDTPFRRRLNTFLARQSAALLMTEYDVYMNYLRSGRYSGKSLRFVMLSWMSVGEPSIGRRFLLCMLDFPQLLSEGWQAVVRKLKNIRHQD